jgi:hypothetical protein
MHAMQHEQKEAIREVLTESETFLPAAHSLIADSARRCVRVQLEVESPDQSVVHRCLEILYHEMRHGTKVENPIKTAFDRTLADVKSCMNAAKPKGDHLYIWIAPKAKILKAVVQMLIGVLAVTRLGAYMWHGHAWWGPRFTRADDSLALIGRALAAATVVELAYTLFTDGPDEVLDPLMLGVSAFLIIELGKTGTQIAWGTGLGLLLSAITLGLLFAIRQRFIEDTERVPRFWWRRLLTK